MKEKTKPTKRGRKPTAGENKEKSYTFLEPELKAKIEEIARAEERSPSAVIRKLIRKALGLVE
ncbi:TPA: ribbon-helix-helix protein, CopG family [Mannheimia haemolytica]